ncbi:MAG TPA: hypothetical protein VK662_04355 [Acidothermaceae bacterium]|nr:hypothetical protein [Acidothermaceae bacterium]
MRNLPHDVSDLYLAPIVLSIDAKLDDLGTLEPRALAQRVALESNLPDWDREDRERALLRSALHFIDCRGWAVTWDPRGLRLRHDEHSLVLGVPANVADYLSGAGAGFDSAR